MLAADIRIAASNTQFGQIEVKRGIYAVGGATVRWLQEIGWGNAMRYLLTGDLLSAPEAHRMGLVQRTGRTRPAVRTRFHHCRQHRATGTAGSAGHAAIGADCALSG